jgi:hypothetical protein
MSLPLRPLGRLLSLLLASVLLISCGGGGGGGNESGSGDGTGGDGGTGGNSAPPTASEAGDPLNYLPLSVGNRWVYAVTYTSPWGAPEASSEMVTISGTHAVAGTVTTVEQTRDALTNALRDEHHVIKSATALVEYHAPGSAPYGQSAEFLTLLRLPLEAGASYQQQHLTGVSIGADIDSDGVHETLKVTTSVSVSGPVSVTLPVGNFSNALKVTSVTEERLTLSGTHTTLSPITTTWEQWLVPGLGPVKRLRTVSSMFGAEITAYELTGYHVEGIRSESTPPGIVQSLPASTGIAITKTGVHLELDELLDPGLIDDQTLTLVDSAGQPVSGTVSFSGQTLSFIPAQPLDGSYTATASNVSDLLGNLLAAHSWTFTMSSTPPTIQSTTPAAATTHVLTRDRLVITFSEAMDANSFTATSATISGGTANTLSASVVNNQVTLTPATRLDYGTTYTVTLTTAIKDDQGDALASNYSFSFTTYPRRLQPAVLRTIGSRPYALLIDDANADGRQDVLVATWYNSSSANDYKLFLYYQQADGTLAEPVKIATASSYGCPIQSLATGDVTGDGTRDIVLGEFGCGYEILQRGSDGTWSSGGLVSTTYSLQTRVADLNNDARLDVVGVTTSGAAVWYQQAAGGLGTATIYPVSVSGFTDLDPADINGDGLTDIVALSVGSNTKALVTLTQASGGGFNAAAYAGPTSYNYLISALEAADINNDGRQDVLLSMGGNTPNAKLGLYYQQGDGSLGALTTQTSYDIPRALEAADMDNDGRNDVVVLHNGWNNVGIHRQLADGTLEGEELFAASSIQNTHAQGLAVGDINGDGYKDVVAGDEGTSELVILYNLGP